MDKSTLLEDISKQIAAGFSEDEIKANLAAKGYDESTIKEYLTKNELPAVQDKKSSFGYKDLLISIAFILIGIYDINRTGSGFIHSWGYILIAIGGIGLLLKLAMLNRAGK